MMMSDKPSFTPRQNDAIKEYGHNILVSAGAGSGKTAVLTERVVHFITNHNYKLDDFLILTFTRLAANEMKVRIRKALADVGSNEAEKVDFADICTFDAYALSLIKKYHFLLKISPDISLVDSTVIEVKKKHIIDDIFEELYEREDKDFLKVIDNKCFNNDKDLREATLKLYKNILLQDDCNEYMDNYLNHYLSDDVVNLISDAYCHKINDKITKFKELLDTLPNIPYTDSDKTTIKEKFYESFEAFFNSKTYDEYIANFPEKTGFTINSTCRSDDDKKVIEKVQGYKTRLKKFLLSEIPPKACMFKDYLDGNKYVVEMLLRIVKELDKRIMEYKAKYSAYEFSDIAKMSIKLVKDNPDIRNEIKNKLKMIMIDEYQDTSSLQESFINSIANDNVYMVGDIKQSIYRFRNANPELFKEKYETYSLSDKDELIELPHNFRSRNEVLEDINVVFDRVMDSRIGGADFLKAHHMLTGREDGVIENQNNHLEILSYEYDSKEEPFDILDRKEYEAFVLAKDILDRVGKYKVNDNGTVRPAQFSDFCILVDRTTNFDMYKQILTYHHIPCVIETDEKMSDSPLITVIRDIFKILTCIDNDDYTYEFEYAYVSLARSFLFEMSDSEIYEIMKNKLFEDTRIMKLIRSIYDSIESKTISDILDEIIDVFDVYEKILKIKDVKENQIKIDYLYQLSHGLNEMAYDYKDFDEYLKSVFESSDDNSDIRYSIDKGGSNAVKIINIHKAKGLQYKICYYVALDVKFNKSDLKDKITFSKDLGVIMPEYIDNRGLKDTIVKQIFKYRYDVEDTSERIRLFYVALTRCEEKMIMICPLKDKHDSNRMVSDYIRIKYSNFNDLLSSIYGDLSPFIKEIDYHDYLLTNKYRNTKKIETDTKQTDRTINIRKHWDIPAELVKSERYSKDSGLIDLKTIENMELGTRLHYYLETLDFNNPDYTVIEKEYVDKIKAFMNCGLMDNVKDGKAYKEYEFVYEEENVLKHGFIDLLMEYDDHFDIIDYKFMNIDDSHYDEQLNGYRKYINSISDKRVDCYLYSIMQEKYREVKERED